MSVLAIDTATEACSVALASEGRVWTRFEVAPREHARLCLPMIESVLAESGTHREDIEWIAFGRGPGAFTGVRVATGIAHGLALGLGVGLYPVSTLAALALRGIREEGADTLLCCLDARMGEVYWGVYRRDDVHQRDDKGQPRLLGEEQVLAPEAVSAPGVKLATALGVGRGWSAYSEDLRRALGDLPGSVQADRLPMAVDLLSIAEAQAASGKSPQSPEEAQPVYLRDRVVKEKPR